MKKYSWMVRGGLVLAVAVCAWAADTAPKPNEKEGTSAGDTINPPGEDTGDPVDIIRGNNVIDEFDLRIPCPGFDLIFSRAYHSAAVPAFSGTSPAFGLRWSHSFETRLRMATNVVVNGVALGPNISCVAVDMLANPYEGKYTGNHFFFGRDVTANTTELINYQRVSSSDMSLSYSTTEKLYHLAQPGGLVFLFNSTGRLDRIEHPSGAFATVEYIGLKPSRITHSNGQYFQITYGGDGHISKVETASPDYWMSYDCAMGAVTQAVRHVSGRTDVVQYHYGPSGLIETRVNAAGEEYRWEYLSTYTEMNAFQQPVTRQYAPGDSRYETDHQYTQQTQRRIVQHRNGQDITTDYTFHPILLKFLQIAGPMPNWVDNRVLDARGNVLSAKQTDSVSGEYVWDGAAYDDADNPTAIYFGYQALTQTVAELTWNQWRQPATITDPRGVKQEIDSAGALPIRVRQVAAGGTAAITTAFTYATGPCLSTITNANGHVTEFEHNAAGYLTNIAPPAGPAVAVVPDSLGHTRSVREPGPNGTTRVTGFDVDAHGRVRAVTNALEQLTTLDLDGIGRMLCARDAAGHTVSNAYRFGKLTSTSRWAPGMAKAETIRLDWDQQMNLVTVYDPLDRNVESYQLDAADRATSVTNLEEQVMTIQYGLADFVKSITRFDGSELFNTFDGLGRLDTTRYPDSTNYFCYLANSLLAVTSNKTASVGLGYDGFNRLTSVTNTAAGVSSVIGYQYDPVGNVTQSVGIAGLTRDWTFDVAERPLTLESEAGQFDITYTTWNGLPATLGPAQTGVHAEYAFDALDRLTNLVWKTSAGAVVRSFGYQYDASGMITNIARGGDTGRVFTYDGLNRLTGEGVAVGGSTNWTTWAYDLAGNRTAMTRDGVSQTYTLGTGNRLVSWGVSGENTAKYDAAGCVTSMTVNAQTRWLRWDGQYRLTAAYENGVLAEAYGYDALGRRAWTAIGETTNHHVYDGIHVLADVDPDGQVLRSYTYGPGVDRLLAMTAHGSGSAQTHYYYITDHLGTVHAITDASGAVVESYDYDAWGNVRVFNAAGTQIPASGIGNRFTFQGREMSWATGLINFRARWYDPVTGRWLSNDPIGISGGLNQYVACGNSPLWLRDPHGLRVINSSDKTIPIIVNPINADGSQGKQRIYDLPPGGDTDVLLPGYDTDAIYPVECQGKKKKVFKIVNRYTVEILPSGGLRFPWYNNPLRTLGQVFGGGWKDDAFIDKWGWPRPAK